MTERMTDAEFEAAQIEMQRLRAVSDRAAIAYNAANCAAGAAFARIEKERKAREVDRLFAERCASGEAPCFTS